MSQTKDREEVEIFSEEEMDEAIEEVVMMD